MLMGEDSILNCTRQCIALREDVEKTSEPGNPGSFWVMLKDIAINDPALTAHLEKSPQKNATYISPRTQSEITDIIGKEVREVLLKKSSKHAFVPSCLMK